MIKFFSVLFLFFYSCAFSWETDKGCLVAFAGISGSGKTTLAKELASLCSAQVFFEPEESEWPEFVRHKHAYSEFSAYSCIRGFRVSALYQAWNLRQNGALVFTDCCYDKITSYYLEKPGMEWLISPHDPYFNCVKLLTKIDTEQLPNPDCIVLLDVTLDDWIQMLTKRGRIRDSIDGFQENYERYNSYIKDAAISLCAEKNIKLVRFKTKFGDVKIQALKLFKVLEEQKIIHHDG